MTIIDRRRKKTTPFREIAVGEIFQLGGDFFIKCYTIEGDEEWYNCANLKTGQFDYCTDTCECLPADAKLVIE